MPDTYRYRITFAKGDALKYTSHLDLMRVWERSLRRAAVPLAYSRGFNPRPKLQLAAALPLGHTGEAELLDVWLDGPVRIEELARRLVPVLPDGLTIGQVQQAAAEEPALQTRVATAEYLVTVEWGELAEQVEARIKQVMAAEDLPHTGRDKAVDLRPLIERLWLERNSELVEGRAGEGEVVLGMHLAARAGATARPEAVMDALGMGEAFARYHRRRLLM